MMWMLGERDGDPLLEKILMLKQGSIMHECLSLVRCL